MKTNFMIAALALIVSGSVLADNSSGVITNLSATAYDSSATNSANATVGNLNSTGGAYAGFSGSYGGAAASNVPIIATPVAAIATTGSGTYNAIGPNASSFAAPAGIQGYGTVSLAPSGTPSTGTAYLSAVSGVQSESKAVGGGYDAHSKSVTNQTASLMGSGLYVGEVVSGAGGMSQAGTLGAVGYNVDTASSGLGTAVIDVTTPTISILGSTTR